MSGTDLNDFLDAGILQPLDRLRHPHTRHHLFLKQSSNRLSISLRVRRQVQGGIIDPSSSRVRRASQRVEKNRNAHFSERCPAEQFMKLLGSGSHQRCMKGRADLQLHASSRALFLCNLLRPGHSFCKTGDYILSFCVVVGYFHNTPGLFCSFLRDLRRLFSRKSQNGAHFCIQSLSCSRHRLPAECRNPDQLFGGKNARRMQRAVFAKAESCHIIRTDSTFGKNRCHSRGKGSQTWLGVSSPRELLLRPLKHHSLQIKIQHRVRLVHFFGKCRICLIQIPAHTGMLASLTGIQKCCFHD